VETSEVLVFLVVVFAVVSEAVVVETVEASVEVEEVEQEPLADSGSLLAENLLLQHLPHPGGLQLLFLH